ncbi:hypothetical protein N431DRAFT_474655 [Stipitochalara longipes BDJ]|nr:hypothetical protein N431DRAFT_474655 [Stipitochalara longipes BDJ]
MVVCAATAIVRSIVPAVFSSYRNPEVTPPLQPTSKGESCESVSGRGGGFQSDPLLTPKKNLELPSHDHGYFGVARDRRANKPRAIEQLNKMGGGGKIPYPKHVWSPAGGWYSQPSNWKANTAVFGMVIVGLTAMMWKLSAEREFRTKFPEDGRFFPSRYWSKQIIEHEKNQKKGGS